MSSPLVAANTADEEMSGYSKSVGQFAKEFPDKPDHSNARYGGGYRGTSSNLKSLNSSYYNQVSKSAYAKSEVMKSLSTLADSLAKTAGSSMALDSATKARQQAAALQGASDPDFQAIGAAFTKEATAIETGDRNQALQYAATIQNMPRPYVPPSYKPTQNESVLVRALNTAVGGVVAALGGVLGGVVVSTILKSLGLNSSFLSGSGSGLGRNLGTTAFNGGNTDNVLNNSGSNLITHEGSSVGSAINQAAPKVEKLPSTSTGQSGAAPSAE